MNLEQEALSRTIPRLLRPAAFADAWRVTADVPIKPTSPLMNCVTLHAEGFRNYFRRSTTGQQHRSLQCGGPIHSRVTLYGKLIPFLRRSGRLRCGFLKRRSQFEEPEQFRREILVDV